MAYLDHAASTPARPEVLDAVRAAGAVTGNASSLHGSGRRARRLVEESRERIAAAVGARPSEVVLTSGGTESDNLAVKGLFWGRRQQDASRTRVLVGATEHHAVLDAVEWLGTRQGARVEVVPVDRLGHVDPDAFADQLGDGGDVALVTVMRANNEIGTVQDVAALARLAAARGVPLHTDAVQALGHVPLGWGDEGVTALALSGHKIGGPRGVGALLLARGAPCAPLSHGGGQERDVRSGSVDVAGAVGLALAVELAEGARAQESARLRALREELVARLGEAFPDAVLNGDPVRRLPGNVHVSFPGCEGDALLMLLDARGVEVSTGSACSAGVARPSHVLLATGTDEAGARASLRISLGWTSTRADVEELLAALPGAVERARAAGLRATGGLPR